MNQIRSLNNAYKSECTEMWNVGDYVWALFNKKYWAAVVISHQDICMEKPRKNKVLLFWFGDYRVSQMDQKYLIAFTANFNRVYVNLYGIGNIHWLTGVHEAVREYGMPKTAYLTDGKLIDWAVRGFSGSFNNKIPYLSDFVLQKLQIIKSNNSEEWVPDSKVPTTSGIKALLKQIVKNPELLDSICLACYSSNVQEQHPIFKGSICAPCRTKIKDTCYVIGEDDIMYFCTICACPGNMIVCGTRNCGRVFCKTCIDELANPGSRAKILKMDPWFCFVCKPVKTFNGLLRVRENWQLNVHRLFDASVMNLPMLQMSAMQAKKPPIRVLSLFDGIGSGYVALKKLDIKVEKYFTCEIDGECLSVMKKNYKSKLISLGDILNLSNEDVKGIMPIDLLIGGSPSNDLNLANPYRKGLYDCDGTGILFFDFYRVLTILRRFNGKPFFWLFENISSMAPECKITMSRFLQCEPALIDAAWVSPQQQLRFYWGNLPILQSQLFRNQSLDLQEYLMPERKAPAKKLKTAATQTDSLGRGSEMKFPVQDIENLEDNVNINELEEVFGFPRYYTQVNGLSMTSRQKLLEKAWNVQVMVLALRILQEHFKVES